MRMIDIEPLVDECDELISIEWNHKVAPPSWADAEEEFKQRLLDAPTIDPEELRPKGRWVMTIYATTSKRGRVISNKKFACSECGYGNGRKQTNYCPNCGAKMQN